MDITLTGLTRDDVLAELRHRMREWQENHAVALTYAAELSGPELQALSALAVERMLEDLPHPPIHYVLSALTLVAEGSRRKEPRDRDRP